MQKVEGRWGIEGYPVQKFLVSFSIWYHLCILLNATCTEARRRMHMRYLLAATILVGGLVFVTTESIGVTTGSKPLPKGNKAAVQSSAKKVSSSKTVKRQVKG